LSSRRFVLLARRVVTQIRLDEGALFGEAIDVDGIQLEDALLTLSHRPPPSHSVEHPVEGRRSNSQEPSAPTGCWAVQLRRRSCPAPVAAIYTPGYPAANTIGLERVSSLHTGWDSIRESTPAGMIRASEKPAEARSERKSASVRSRPPMT